MQRRLVAPGIVLGLTIRGVYGNIAPAKDGYGTPEGVLACLERISPFALEKNRLRFCCFVEEFWRRMKNRPASGSIDSREFVLAGLFLWGSFRAVTSYQFPAIKKHHKRSHRSQRMSSFVFSALLRGVFYFLLIAS